MIFLLERKCANFWVRESEGVILIIKKNMLCGFLNPFIYQNPSAFQDVTKGTNNDGHSHGFKAVKGWDAATGMGTPNFEALSKAIAALP